MQDQRLYKMKPEVALELVQQMFLNYPRRLSHTLSVAKLAKTLSEIHHVDVDKALVASYMHDITKYFTHEESIRILQEIEPEMDYSLWEKPTLHALVASCYIQKIGIHDIDIINAVRYHTTGRANMSSLEKIIYISDYAEETRSFNPVEIREISKVSLNQAVYMIERREIASLQQRGMKIMDLSYQALKYYQKAVEENK